MMIIKEAPRMKETVFGRLPQSYSILYYCSEMIGEKRGGSNELMNKR